MNESTINKLILFYDEYVEFSWSKDFHFSFWKIKLDEIVETLTNAEVENFSNELNYYSKGIFSTYDISSELSERQLRVRMQTKAINRETINDDKNVFLREIINLSIVRYHDSLERLLKQIINECYIHITQFDVYNRTCLNKLIRQMNLPTEDNCMHLLYYLEINNTMVKGFFDSECNIDLKVSWKRLFEFFGVIRNTVVHNAMLMTWNNYSNYLTHYADAFHYFFEKPARARQFILQPRLDRAGMFALYSDQFATNVIKSIAGKSDLAFLQLYP